MEVSSERSVRDTTKHSSAVVATKEIPKKRGKREKQTTKKEKSFLRDLDELFDIAAEDKQQVKINYQLYFLRS